MVQHHVDKGKLARDLNGDETDKESDDITRSQEKKLSTKEERKERFRVLLKT